MLFTMDVAWSDVVCSADFCTALLYSDVVSEMQIVKCHVRTEHLQETLLHILETSILEHQTICKQNGFSTV